MADESLRLAHIPGLALSDTGFTRPMHARCAILHTELAGYYHRAGDDRQATLHEDMARWHRDSERAFPKRVALPFSPKEV